jgi:hypothetical protein
VRARRLLVSALPFVLTAGVACAPRDVVAGSACQLTQLNGSAIEKDVPSSAAPLGRDVVSVGTRFQGSAGTALAAFASDGTWDPKVIPAWQDHVVELDDVSTVDGSAWAVGALASSTPVAARWDGQAWTPVTVPDPGPGEDGFSGVTALSGDRAWAVGRHQTGYAFRTLIDRWDGAAWTAVPSPNVGSTSNMLKDVDAGGADDVWAVGWYVQARHYRPLVEHWDGTTWSLVTTPDPGPGDAFLSGVAAVGPRDAWAVGWTSRGGQLGPLIEHWDGRSWSLVEPPADVAHGALLSIAPAPTGVVMVGRSFPTAQPQPLALERIGSTWTTLTTPVADPAWFNGVTVDAAGAIWAVGTVFPADALAGSLVMTGCSAS